MKLTEIFAKNVRLNRRLQEMSQKTLAEKTGKALTAVNNLEMKQLDVRISDIEKYAHALGVEPHELLKEN